jgi:hypothetical protein
MCFLFFTGILIHRNHDDGEVIMRGNALHERSHLRRCFLQQDIGRQSP